MVTEKWEKKNAQNDAPFVAFYDMHALSHLFCQMKWQMCSLLDCSGLFLYPDKTIWGLTGQVIPVPNPIYIEKKN